MYRGKNIVWQYGTRLTKYGSTEFTYDGLGRRTKKGSITYTYDNDGRLLKQSNGLEFVYDNAGVVGVIYGGAQYFYRKDAQGNIIGILDSEGDVVVKYVYDAWVNHGILDTNGNNVESGIGYLNPFRYRGYYYDNETELYYLQTRYYDPEVGRFISQDSIEYADPETINGLNLYAYCGNNPVMNVDPTGTWDWGIFASIITFLVSTVALVTGVALTITGFGAPIGTVLIGAGVGGLLELGGSILTQGYNKGWNNINWGQVAFNGSVGALIGGIMSSPFGAIATGISIGIIGALESVGNDLFDNNYEWHKVEWGQAIITGALLGTVSGFGKIFVNAGNALASSVEAASTGIPAVDVIYSALGKFVSKASTLITAGLRFVFKSLAKLINF